jgi:hypothetical protein
MSINVISINLQFSHEDTYFFPIIPKYMSQERLQQLLQFLQEEPNDPFLQYAIAQAYQGFEPEKALHYYRHLLLNHPDYLPTYYHAALLMAELGIPNEADATFQKGIALSQAQGNLKTMREIQNAYQNFQFEQD